MILKCECLHFHLHTSILTSDTAPRTDRTSFPFPPFFLHAALLACLLSHCPESPPPQHNNSTLEPTYAKLWVEHGAVDALASCLESHAEFDRANPVSNDLPLCFFLVATSLLAGAADSVSDDDKVRLGKAWIQIFVEANMWVAHESADLLPDFFTRPNWLKGTVGRIPESLRARAVQAARACEREGKGGGSSWKRGSADRLALALLCGNAYTWGEGGKLVGRKCAGPACDRVQKCGDDAATGSCAVAAAVDGDEAEGGEMFKRCSQCRAVSYCSRECQKADWKGHRKACMASRSS